MLTSARLAELPPQAGERPPADGEGAGKRRGRSGRDLPSKEELEEQFVPRRSRLRRLTEPASQQLPP